MWREELPDLRSRHAWNIGVETDESREESDGGSGEVHNVVVEYARLYKGAERLGWFGGLGCGARELDLGVYGYRAGIVEQLDSAGSDESGTIGVEGAHIRVDFIRLDILVQVLVGVRVEIVGPYKALLLPCGNSEWPDAGHDVAYCVAFFEEAAKALVLCVESCVPVDLGKVEVEDTTLLADLYVQVVGPM